MKLPSSLFSVAAAWLAVCSLLDCADAQAPTHPLDGLSASEYETVVQILQGDGHITNSSRFSTISLVDPDKETVKAWMPGDGIPRQASAVVKDGPMTYKAIVDLITNTTVSWEIATGQGMLLFEEFLGATELALSAPKLVEGLAARGFTPDQVYCAPLTAGWFGLPEEDGSRIMKAPCFGLPNGTSNWFAFPIEGLFATIDLRTNSIMDVVDTGVVPVAEDPWGYTGQEIKDRFGYLRPNLTDEEIVEAGQAEKQTPPAEELPYTIENSLVSWDIWRFHYRLDKRPGATLSQIEVNDRGNWRSVLYEAHLSEVFVPYSDPDVGWYFRTYMDSGEYGFGIFMSPLKPGVDCPASATYLDVTMPDDFGMPFSIPDTICIFERYTGDPVWRHYELFEQSPTSSKPAEGRANKELVVRYAAQVGNYDYLVDYRFLQDGTIKIGVGSTGIDAVKGVATQNMADPTAANDTAYGTLIAPNIVAPNHGHFFNFRLDFDIDGTENDFKKAKLVPKTIPASAGVPRRSLWQVEYEMPPTEIPARTQINPMSPSNLLFVNHNTESALGHNPGYQLVPDGSYAYPLLSPDDPPVIRNPYINHQLQVTPFDPTQIYAGGEYTVSSNGSDTLGTWTDANRSIANTDIVAWYTVGFQHVPRMEDWPVMSMNWKVFELRPFNFFGYNPAISVAPESSGASTSDATSSVGKSSTTDQADATKESSAASAASPSMITMAMFWLSTLFL